MVTPGSILPGALIMVNNDLSATIQSRLETQLHIDESITGAEFDLRVAADPNYPRNIRILRRRLMVIRDHRDTTNREEMDIVMFVKSGMISVTKNCYGPPGQTYLLKNVYWGALCIYHTVLDRTCQTVCQNCGGAAWTYCDGYGRTPYYPATYDPAHPQENHNYNQQNAGCCNGCGGCCNADPEYQLCRTYFCNSSGCIPQLDCRLVKG
jgi:hypothetical protein